MKMDFKQILMVLGVSYGLLWLLKAIGVLSILTGWIAGYWPSEVELQIGTVNLGNNIAVAIPALSGLLAIIAVALISTLIANSLVIGFKDKDFLPTLAILAVVSAALWIAMPQILPSILQPAAGAAQSLLGGGVPQALMMP